MATVGAPKQPRTPSSEPELLSPRKTLVVLAVVVGCFAVLWPKLFYPMLVANRHIQPSIIDRSSGCCDVISETDVNTMKIMSELCSTIISNSPEKLTNEQVVAKCRSTVLETCGIDISAVLQEKAGLGHSVKQILEEVRSLNGSLCLKYNFGVSPGTLGVPHRVIVRMEQDSIRQERPPYLRSEMVHPAFREKGRAIPHTEAQHRRANPPPRIVEGRPGPIPGLRHTMGAAGHVVPPKQQGGAGVMGLLMPVYTVAIVVFFTYTVMKLAFKKKPESYPGSHLYPSVQPDEHFEKEVFQQIETPRIIGRENNSRLVVNAMSALLDEVDQELVARSTALTRSPPSDQVGNGSAVIPEEREEPSVQVLGMEMRASCEDGAKWGATRRPGSPMLPPADALPAPLHPPTESSGPTQEIYLEGTLPPQSQLLVTDSATEAQKNDEDPSVVLAGKMTLSVISLDSENGSDDSDKKRSSLDDERRTSSSHTSEDFEKIEEGQISEIDDNINSMEESKLKLEEFEVEGISGKSNSNTEVDIMQESKHEQHEHNLDDDLLKVLKSEVDKLNETVTEHPQKEEVERIFSKREAEAEAKNQAHHIQMLESVPVKIQNTEVDEATTEILPENLAQEDDDLLKVIKSEVDKRNETVTEQPQKEVERSFLKGEAEAEAKNQAHRIQLLESVPVKLQNIEADKTTTVILPENLAQEDDDLPNVLQSEVDKLNETVTEQPQKEVEGSFTKREADAEAKNQAHEVELLESVSVEIQNTEADKVTTEILSENPAQEAGKLNFEDDILKVLKSEVEKIDERVTEQPQKEDIERSFTQREAEAKAKNQTDEVQLARSIPNSGAIQDAEADKVTKEIPSAISTREQEKEGEEKEDEEEEEEDEEEEEEDEEEEVEEQPNQSHEAHGSRNVTQQPEDEDDYEEEVIEDVEYESEDEEIEDEIRGVERLNLEERIPQERMNGDDADQSKHWTTSSNTVAENEISDEEADEDDEEEEIEEIIEYVDNTDEEGEEIIEVNEIDHENRNVNNEHH